MKAISLNSAIFQCVMILFWILPSQRTVASKPTINRTGIAQTDLADFAGFYQFPNKVAYIQFLVKDGNLQGLQVWDGRIHSLVRKGDLSFETSDGEYTVEFAKDAAGSITTATVSGRKVLTKVDYNPTEVPVLTLDELQRLEGRYQFQKDNNLTIEISVVENGLQLKQSWDDELIRFTPRTALEFYNAERTFPLTFVVEAGQVKRVICFEHDVWVKIN